MNTPKFINQVPKKKEKNHKFTNISSNLTDLDIQGVPMLYFR